MNDCNVLLSGADNCKTGWEMDKNFDYVVLGAGVIGLNLALKVAESFPEAKIAVFEKENSIGKHASGRNSGVVHAGFYYPPNTLKAKLCAQGSTLLTQFCEENNILFERCGKVVVPPPKTQKPELTQKLLNHAAGNNVVLHEVDQKELRKLEPNIHPDIEHGLYSPNTAMLNPKLVIKCLLDKCVNKGVEFFFSSMFQAVDLKQKCIVFSDGIKVNFGQVLNCCGAYADKVAKQFGLSQNYQILPFKGKYLKIDSQKANLVNAHIYPYPNLSQPFLGVHLSRSIDGALYAGPSATPAFGRENYLGLEGIEWDDIFNIIQFSASHYLRNEQNYRSLVHRELKNLDTFNLLEEVQELVPDIEIDEIAIAEKVGIRPQVVNTITKKLEMDFVIEKNDLGVHLVNTISPAFTSSIAITNYIFEKYI